MHTTEQLNTALAGRYAIDRLVGEGGMATVYLARDVRHNRKVALKVLKPDLGAIVGVDRFLSEIQVTANLQHPNLLPLFDSGTADGLLFYVMPYVEGESLRAQLDREKQLPVEDAVHIAVAIASALAYAHRQGVIHRDLKPENILMHEGQPLVADFGIALALSNAGGNRITQTGLSLGTPQYMSPEQATGDRTIDARTDIYSLGAVTYEMLTGEAPHTGSTSQAVIARVLTEKPRSIRVSRPNVPAHVEGAVEHALEKLPADRWATAKEFSEALTGARPVTSASGALSGSSDVARAPVARRVAPRELAAWALALVALAVAGAGVFGGRAGTSGASGVPLEFEVLLPDSLVASVSTSSQSIAFSRDGSTLVFQGTRSGERPTLYVRRMSDRSIQRIPGTEGGSRPSMSPAGDEIVFTVGTVLRRISLRGGTARTIVDSAGGPNSWGDAHQIVYQYRSRLWIVSEDGGAPRLLAAPDSSRQHAGYGNPEILPGGRAALINIWKVRTVIDSAVLGVVTIPDGKVTELGLRGTAPRYSPTGHILFATPDNVLFSAPFSLRSRRITGAMTTLAEGVQLAAGGSTAYAVAGNGTLAYIGGASGSGGGRELVAVSRAGVEVPLGAPPGWYQTPRISPDGRYVAMTAFTQGGVPSQTAPDPDVWRIDLRSKVPTRVTNDSVSSHPAWSPDAERVFYVQRDSSVVLSRPLYATDQPTMHFKVAAATIWGFAGGRAHGYVAFEVFNGSANPYDIWIAHADSAESPRPLLAEPYNESVPQISPDGRLLVYVTNKTGSNEVYVRPLTGNGAEVRVSAAGGIEPMWARSSRELFYRSAGYIMSARLADGPRLDVARTDTVFRDTYLRSRNANYDVFPDGKSLLMMRNAGTQSFSRPLIVMTNWWGGQK